MERHNVYSADPLAQLADVSRLSVSLTPSFCTRFALLPGTYTPDPWRPPRTRCRRWEIDKRLGAAAALGVDLLRLLFGKLTTQRMDEGMGICKLSC